MNNINIESQFLKFPTSMISDALDEIGINGVIPGKTITSKKINS